MSMLLGALSAGILMETYGRKRIIQLAFLPLILGWAIICLSESVFIFYVGRVFTGYAMGKINFPLLHIHTCGYYEEFLQVWIQQ